jgi:hypothetical protein
MAVFNFAKQHKLVFRVVVTAFRPPLSRRLLLEHLSIFDPSPNFRSINNLDHHREERLHRVAASGVDLPTQIRTYPSMASRLSFAQICAKAAGIVVRIVFRDTESESEFVV